MLPPRPAPAPVPTPSRLPGRPRKNKEREKEKGREKYLKQLLSDQEVEGAAKSHDSLKLPTLGDARIEHLLLAARRIGKQRVARLAPIDSTTIMKQGSSQPPITPRTPRVQPAATNTVSTTKGRLPHPTLSPAQTSAESQVGSSPTRPLRPALRNSNAHSSQTQQLPRRHESTLMATPSGLESLLSAARSVLDPQEGSPSKRRRIDSTPNAEARISPVRDDGAGRAMSALDVLADQAAAFGSHSDSTSAESATSPPQPTRLTRGVTFPSLDTSRPRIDPKGKSRARGLERSSTELQTHITPPTLGPAFTLRTTASEITPKTSSVLLQPPIATLSDPPSPMGPPQFSTTRKKHLARTARWVGREHPLT